jgi:hypothetical protein
VFLAPTNAGLNVNATFNVRVLEFTATVVAATFSEHWLFCNVVALPTVADCQTVALSFKKLIWLVAVL